MTARKFDLLILASVSALALACGDSDGGGGTDGGLDGGGGGTGGTGGLSCGTGTIEQDGMCVSDPGLRIDCGAGTFEHMGECVPFDPDDSEAPTTTAEPSGGRYLILPAKVTLTTNEPAKIYYTTDGSAPDTNSDFQPSPAVIAPITDGMEIRFFAEDPTGNAEDPQSETYEQAVTPPSPVTDVTVTMNGNDATVGWTVPADADGVVVVQVGTDDTQSPTAGESYAEDDMIGDGTVVYVGTGEFTATDLPVGVTSWLIYAYNDVLLYSGGVLARSGEVALPTQDGELTIDVADTSVSVGTNPADLTLTAGNVVYDGIGGTVSVDVTVENETPRTVFMPKMLVLGMALSGGGDATLDNTQQGLYPDTAGEVTGTVDVTGLTLPGDVNPGVMNLYAGNGIQNIDFADPGFSGTTPASLIQYINGNSTGLVASLDGSDRVVITNVPTGGKKYTYVSNSGVGTTLGFDGISNYGTDIPFVYLCPDDPDADDDVLIDDRTLCMRALRPGESVTKTLVFGNVVSDSIVTVDFELRGDPMVIGGDDWQYNNTTYSASHHLPIFDVRANTSTGVMVTDNTALGPNSYFRTSAYLLEPDGLHALIGSKVTLRVMRYDLRTSRPVGGADLETGRGSVQDMAYGPDGFLYVLLQLNQHHSRWNENGADRTSEAVLLRLDPNTLEELARAHVVMQRPEYTAPATQTTTVAVTGLSLPSAVTGATLEVSVNGDDPQTIDFASPMFTGTTGASLAAFINARSTGITATYDSMADRLIIESEDVGKDASYQFNSTAAATTLGIATTLFEGDETATLYAQQNDSYAPRARWFDISPDGTTLAFGVVNDALSIQGVYLRAGQIYVIDLTSMEVRDYDDTKDGVQPIYLQGAIDEDDPAEDRFIIGPSSIAFTPDGSKVFTGGDDESNDDGDTDGQAYAMVEVESGDVTFFRVPGTETAKRFWRRPDGTIWFTTWSELYEVDPDDGELTLINGLSHELNAFTPSGRDGHYFAKHYRRGMHEVAPDGTEIFFADWFCISAVGDNICTNTTSNTYNTYNYGKHIIATPY